VTKREFRLKLCKIEDDVTKAWVNAESGTVAEAFFDGEREMVKRIFDLTRELDDISEPEPPKKARRINLTNTDGYWYWEIWQEEEPGSWGKVFSMTMGYASIAEAAELAQGWLRDNP